MVVNSPAVKCHMDDLTEASSKHDWLPVQLGLGILAWLNRTGKGGVGFYQNKLEFM